MIESKKVIKERDTITLLGRQYQEITFQRKERLNLLYQKTIVPFVIRTIHLLDFYDLAYNIRRVKATNTLNYSGTSLKRTLKGQKFLSALERCPPWRGLN